MSGALLQDRVAVVTGAGGGIGRAIALRFAREGARVACLDIEIEHTDPLSLKVETIRLYEETVKAVQAAGGEAMGAAADVTQADQVERAVGTVLDGWKRVDILVNNAGITRDGLVMRMKDDDWNRVLQVNLTGAFLMSRAVVRPMMRAQNGRIINISSVIGLIGNAGQANYAASKAGLIGLTKSLAREVASRNILVNAIAPGFIDTAMTRALGDEARERLLQQIPTGRLGQPEDVAAVATFLASDLSSYVTGIVVNVSGGMVT